MCRPVQMGFTANFHVKNSTRLRNPCDWLSLIRVCDKPVSQNRSARVRRWKCTTVQQTLRPVLSVVIMLFSCIPRGNDIKTKDASGVCCQNGKYGPLYVSHSNYTNCKKVVLFMFVVLLSLSSNVCQVSSRSFNTRQKISSAIHHHLTFKFIFLQAVVFFFFFFFLPICRVYLETGNLWGE